MADSFNDKRIKLLKGQQCYFINKCSRRLGMTNDEIARLLKVSVRTLTDWRREKFLISFSALKFLSDKASIKIPKNIKLMDKFWYVHDGASKGGRVVYKKYGIIGGNQEKRKEAWRKWWRMNGSQIKHKSILQPRPIRKPKFSVSLAELVGILLGDGGISKYQVVVTLNSITDKQYILYVVKLFKKLFNVTPSVNKIKNTLASNIVVSRVSLVRFCVNELGLKIGNKVKQQVDIPDWIKLNKQFSVACVRGLVDTDGSVFMHRYFVSGKRYGYKKLDYTSISKPLLQSVYEILKKNDLFPRLSRNKSVRLDSIQDMQHYFEIFSTNNPKHLKKYHDKV